MVKPAKMGLLHPMGPQEKQVVVWSNPLQKYLLHLGCLKTIALEAGTCLSSSAGQSQGNFSPSKNCNPTTIVSFVREKLGGPK